MSRQRKPKPRRSTPQSDPEALLKSAAEHLAAGRPAQAANLCTRVLRHEPRHDSALYLRGMIHWQAGETDDAIDRLRQALDVNSAHGIAWNNLAAMLGQSGRTQEAIAALRSAERCLPDSADLQVNLGNALTEVGDEAAAAAAYEQALTIDAHHGAAARNLGLLRRAQGQLDEAIGIFERQLRHQPDNARLLNDLGTTQLESGDAESALPNLQRAVTLQPDDASIHYNLGLTHAHRDDADSAIAAYRQAIACDPRHAKARESLGRLLHRIGRTDDCLAVYHDWLNHCPGHPTALHMLAAVTGDDIPDRASGAYVSDLFDRFADQFDHSLQRLDYRGPELVAAAIADTGRPPSSDLDVLDAGCGTGLCAPLLRPWARTLTGVDLSAGMLAQAQRRGGYDELVEADLVDYLTARTDTWDVIAAADTFIYFGDLRELLAASAAALRPGGLLAFTLEDASPPDQPESETPFQLGAHGRYAHQASWVQNALSSAGLTPLSCESAVVRFEDNQPVHGLVITARRAPADH